jgi:hypothetical protein
MVCNNTLSLSKRELEVILSGRIITEVRTGTKEKRDELFVGKKKWSKHPGSCTLTVAHPSTNQG